MMIRLLGLLMVMGLWIGCDGDRDNPLDSDSPTGTDENELLVWTITWEDGNVKEEYQYYNHPESGKRIKEGWYNSYFKFLEEGWLRNKEVGRYKDNKRVGEWIFNGLRNDELGYYELKGTYKDGMYWSGGFLMYKEDFEDSSDDPLAGLPDKQVRLEMYYKDGKRHGKNVWHGVFIEGGNEYCYDMGESVDCPDDD